LKLTRPYRLWVPTVALTLVTMASCSSKPTDPPPPVPTVDLTGYFLLPGTGFSKFFSDGDSRTYVGPDTLNGHNVVDVLNGSNGSHDYFRQSDRAWAGNLDSGTIFLFVPPLAAPPDLFPSTSNHVATSSIPTQTTPLPVTRISRLVNTQMMDTVPAGIFDSVVMIRQEFWLTRTVLGVPVTSIDSAYRWYAPGVDEIRATIWNDGDTASSTREFIGGTIDGRTYP
jgi:hypothetical protein